MSLSLLPLLLHEEDVPAAARAALREAVRAPALERRAHLEAAARALYREADLECADARDCLTFYGRCATHFSATSYASVPAATASSTGKPTLS